MAGWVSLEALREQANEIAKEQIRPKESHKAPFSKSALTYWSSADSLLDTKKTIDLLGRYLARAIAHEARHQYVLPHSVTKLGADMVLMDDRNATRFSSEDQNQIRDAISRFETQQKNATLIPLWTGSGQMPF